MIEMDSKKIHENIDFVELKKIYKEGQNVTQYLAQKFSLANIDAEIIKYAYDLQAGSYTDFYTKNNSLWEEIGLERAEILRKFGDSPSSLLDGGTGEATTLTAILNNFSGKPQTIHAFDISFSRLLFAQAFLKRGRFDGSAVKLAVADLRKIPYAYNSFDLVITTEAIEPNGGYVEEIISELFRVARQRIIMIEPYYERSSLEARARMDQHKYVKNLPKVIEKLGGEILATEELKVNVNSLNPYWAFVVVPPQKDRSFTSIKNPSTGSTNYQCPISATPLRRMGQVLYSDASGLAYPVVNEIALLDRSNFFPANALPVLLKSTDSAEVLSVK